MRLTDLKAYFTQYQERAVPPDQFFDGIKHPDGVERSYRKVYTLEEADGIWFLCPLCYAKNGGEAGNHWHSIGFRGKCPTGSYTKGSDGQDTRWDVVGGTGLHDLQLSPSIQTVGGCNWHGFVGSSGVPPGEAA